MPACNVSLACLAAQFVISIGQKRFAAGFLGEQQAVAVIDVTVIHAVSYRGSQLTVGRIFIAIAQIASFSLDKIAVDIPLVRIRYTIAVLGLD